MRAAVDELHAAGVKVLIPYNPWDTSTRREEGKPGRLGDPSALALLGQQVGADGFNGDTMSFVAESFFERSLTPAMGEAPSVAKAMAIEPELMGPPKCVAGTPWAGPTGR